MKFFKLRYDETSLPLDELKRRWADIYLVSTADFSNGMDALNLSRLNKDTVRNVEIRSAICKLFDSEIAAGNLVAPMGIDGIRRVSGLELTRFADIRGVEITQDKRTGGRPSHAQGWYEQLENIEKFTAQHNEVSELVPPAAASEGMAVAHTDHRSDSSPSTSDTERLARSEEQVEPVTPEFQAAPADLPSTQIPGHEPNIAIRKLAVKAAWEIEWKEKRRATDKEVLECLQTWAEKGDKPDVLIKSDRKNRRVFWATNKRKEKDYTMEACRKTLEDWNKSRQ